jgi:hypothetical protein
VRSPGSLERIVIVTMDVSVIAQQWVVRDYLPELLGQHTRFPTIDFLCELLPNGRSEVLPVPRDCEDGFMAAWWARPEAYLDPVVRVATSPWHDLPEAGRRSCARAVARGSRQRRVATALQHYPHTGGVGRRAASDHRWLLRLATAAVLPPAGECHAYRPSQQFRTRPSRRFLSMRGALSFVGLRRTGPSPRL